MRESRTNIYRFFKYKITICPNLALYFAENEELLVVYALAICIKNEAGSALFSCSVSDSMIFLVRLGSPHSLSFNRQFNALSFILGVKDEFIITKAKRGGKESFSFFVYDMHNVVIFGKVKPSFVCISIAIVGDCRSLRIEFSSLSNLPLPLEDSI